MSLDAAFKPCPETRSSHSSVILRSSNSWLLSVRWCGSSVSLWGDAGVLGCRAATGEEEGVDGPLKDARRLLISNYVQRRDDQQGQGKREWA